jgi:hypothetical protein
MSWRVRTAFAAMLLFAALPLHSAGTRVSVVFDGLLLSQAAHEVGTQAGLTFGFPPDLGQRLGPNVRLTSVPPNIAVDVFAAAYQVCLVRTPQVIHVRRCDIQVEES